MGKASFAAQTTRRVAFDSVHPHKILGLAFSLWQQSGMDKQPLIQDSVLAYWCIPAAHRVTRPWGNYLGFAQHCQMSSLGHSSSKFADFCGVGEHIQLVISNYEGGIYLKNI